MTGLRRLIYETEMYFPRLSDYFEGNRRKKWETATKIYIYIFNYFPARGKWA